MNDLMAAYRLLLKWVAGIDKAEHEGEEWLSLTQQACLNQQVSSTR